VGGPSRGPFRADTVCGLPFGWHVGGSPARVLRPRIGLQAWPPNDMLKESKGTDPNRDGDHFVFDSCRFFLSLR
jgi:hypothetical protein